MAVYINKETAARYPFEENCEIETNPNATEFNVYYLFAPWIQVAASG
jgi:hypothetical protein